MHNEELHRQAEQHLQALKGIVAQLHVADCATIPANDYGLRDNDRPAVELAERIARELLTAANVDDLGGCPLCRS